MRYGERTARGIAGGRNVACALTLRERRRMRIGKRIMVSCDTTKDHALFRLPVTSAPGRIGHSQKGRESYRNLGKGREPLGDC